MTDTQLQALLNFLEASTKKAYEDDDVPEEKEIIENLPYLNDQNTMHTLDVLYPDKKQQSYPFILYIHGGGFCMHSKDELYRHFALRFTQDCFAVVNINYRLAPDASYMDIIHDIKAVLAYLQQRGTALHLNLKQMFVAGDSAGAYLAAIVPILSKSYHTLSVQGVASCCGLFDFQTFLHDKACKFPIKKEMIHLLFQDDIPASSSLLQQVTPSYPPIYLMDSAYQSFSNEAKRMEAIAIQNNIPYMLHIFSKEEKLPHNFQLFSKYPQSALVLNEIFAFFHQQI